MRLKLLLVCALAAAGLSVSAQFDAEKALLSLPKEILSPAAVADVADAVDYVKAGLADRTVKNLLGGEMSVKMLTPMHAEISTGYGRTLSIDLLPAKGDTLIALTETLLLPAADSKLTVFSRQWTPLPKAWTEPGADEWLNKAGRANRRDFEDSVPFITAEYQYDPASEVLTLTSTCESDAYVVPALYYKWNGKQFKKIKTP